MKDFLLWFIGKRKRYVVFGESMAPRIKCGERIWVKPYNARRDKLRANDVIVFNHPYRKNTLLLKKVAALNGDKIAVYGESSLKSTDSRAFGDINKKDVVGIL